MSKKISRRSLLGALLAGLLGPFARRAQAQAPPPALPPAPVDTGATCYPIGVTVTSVYDADGRLTYSTYLGGAGSAVTYTYDASGRLTPPREDGPRGQVS